MLDALLSKTFLGNAPNKPSAIRGRQYAVYPVDMRSMLYGAAGLDKQRENMLLEDLNKLVCDGFLKKLASRILAFLCGLVGRRNVGYLWVMVSLDLVTSNPFARLRASTNTLLNEKTS